MKKFVLLVLFFLTAVLIFSQFYENLDMGFRKDLAEAYYLVGKQYKTVGKAEKGDDFIAMAYSIYPELNPDTINPDKRIVKRAPMISSEWKPSFTPMPPGVTSENAVKYQFSRLLRYFLTENVEGITEVLDTRIYGPSADVSVSRDDFRKRLIDFFDAYEISDLPPSQLLDMTSIKTEPVSRQIWAASILVARDPVVDISRYLNPGDRKQVFFFRQVGRKWKVFAVGSLPRALDQVIQPEKYVQNVMLSVLNAFVQRDIMTSISYFTDPFTDITSARDLSRDDLFDLFSKYAEEFDFSELQDMHMTLSIEESTEIAESAGKMFKVYVRYDSQGNQRLPFWSSYQGTYVVFDEIEKAWKIRAIF